MTLTQLRYVLAVAKHRNFTHAAKEFSVTQPTLSMQIQKLEEELGTPLFKREKRTIIVTEIGERIVEQAQNIITESERIQEIITQAEGYVGGSLKLGMTPTTITPLLPLFLDSFLQYYTEVALEIEECPPQQLLKRLQEGSLDAGIMATPNLYERLKKRVLYYEPFQLYIPQNHVLAQQTTIAPQLLKENEVLLLQGDDSFTQCARYLEAPVGEVLSTKFMLRTKSVETLLQLCDRGFGLTIIPELYGLQIDREKRQQIHSFESPAPAREVSILSALSGAKNQIVEALQNEITKAVQPLLPFQEVKLINSF